MADSSEMRALGIAAHFANVFAKEGGTLDMLNWVAHEPARMQQIVQIADTWLLVRGSSVRIKIAYCGTYNPREFFTIGEHNGVRIVRVIGNVEMFAPDETRPIQSISLVPYTARKSTNLSAVFNEVNRLKEAEVTSVDHVRAALVLSAQSRENPILAMDGNVNQFYVPHKVRIGVVHFPVRLTYILDERGWELDVPMSMGTGDIVRQGTRIILDGDKSQ
ncbi:MAG: hypothetical protein JWL75_104 [Parcubacteria group bacterium]|nr:hypothetical protein [Parcubacteria group bacterium]